MMDGSSDGAHGGGDHHGAYGLDGSHDSGHHAQYMAIGSCAGAHQSDISAHVVQSHSHAMPHVDVHSGAHHVGVHMHHVDSPLVHFDHFTLQSALDASPSKPAILKTPTHQPDGEVIRSYLFYVDRHAQFDLISELRKVAASLGIICLDTFRPNFDDVSLIHYTILDRQAWTHAQAIENGKVPEEVYCGCDNAAAPGWYDGATGYTRLCRQHWQIGRVPGLGIAGKPEYDPHAHTFLEIEMTTWSFAEAGDFSTAFEVRIVSLSEYDHVSGQFGYRKEHFERHQRVAIKLFEYMLTKLLLVEKTAAEKNLRAEIDRRFIPPCETASLVPTPVGKPGEKADLVIVLDD